MNLRNIMLSEENKSQQFTYQDTANIKKTKEKKMITVGTSYKRLQRQTSKFYIPTHPFNFTGFRLFWFL